MEVFPRKAFLWNFKSELWLDQVSGFLMEMMFFERNMRKPFWSFSLATISSFDAAPLADGSTQHARRGPYCHCFLGAVTMIPLDLCHAFSLLLLMRDCTHFLAFILLSFFSQVGHWYPALFQKRRLRFLSDDVCVFWVCPSCFSINSSVGKDPKLPCIQIWWGWCLLFSSAKYFLFLFVSSVCLKGSLNYT